MSECKKKGAREMNLPQCPWPKDIWTMESEEYVKAIPDEKTRTAISGYLMRKGWEVYRYQLLKSLKDQIESE